MPSFLLHALAVEALAEAPELLPAPLARALTEDLEYARFGALLPDMPSFDGLRGGFQAWGGQSEPPKFARLFHSAAPVKFGLKMAELVASGALVGREAGLAVVTGYFTHLCLDRALHPRVDALVTLHRLRNEPVAEAHRRVEWTHALYYARDRFGRALVGTPDLLDRFRVSKSRLPTRGIGRGLYELLRLSAQDVLGEAPTKDQVDAWLRGLFVYGLLMSSPLGKARAVPNESPLSRRELYDGDDVDIHADVNAALTLARQVLTRLTTYLDRGIYSARARMRFLEDFPEGSVDACAA
jgi:hypothetical protein